MNPWKTKETIDLAISAADRNGFRLDQHFQYGEKICLLTKGSNEHGFANDIVLFAFTTWEEAVTFFAGWEKHDLAQAVARTKKIKEKKC